MKYTIIFLVLITTSIFAQKDDYKFSSTISNTTTKYWEQHPELKDKKGSGYKQYKRWENRWKSLVNSDGTIMSSGQLWSAWRLKQKKTQNDYTKNTGAESNWYPVGPTEVLNNKNNDSHQLGRVNVIEVDPSNPDIIYVGTPAGGIWKTTNGGQSWIALSDYLPQIGVSGIAIDPTNTNIIYIATGDNDSLDSFSLGVLKSTDGGLTWNTTGLSFSDYELAGDIIIHPTDSQTLLCGTSLGLFKTVDGGLNWTLVQSGYFSNGSLRFKTDAPSVIYACSSHRFYKSTDIGSSFSEVNIGGANSSRMLLDVSPANPDIVYVLFVENNMAHIYISTDSGNSFTLKSQEPTFINQSWYNLALVVSPTDINKLYLGGVFIVESDNGGESFSLVYESLGDGPHVDYHFLKYFSGILYMGNDGGVYRIVDDSNSSDYENITSNMQISQIYQLSVSENTSDVMLAGLQDNGGISLKNDKWYKTLGGDGTGNAISKIDDNLVYGFPQNGSILTVSSNVENFITYGISKPSGESAAWVAPLCGNSNGDIFGGFNNLYRLECEHWERQNQSDFSTNEHINCITIDPLNEDIIYVAKGSNLFKSIDNGHNFTLSATSIGYINDIAVHSEHSNIIYISSYGAGHGVYKSIDGGNTFNMLTLVGLPSNFGVRCLVLQGRHSQNPIYVGTSLGVYYIDDSMTEWEPFDTNLPNNLINDLKIQLKEGKIFAGTYGRGVWASDIPIETPPYDIALTQIIAPVKNIFYPTSFQPKIETKNIGENTITTININYKIDDIPFNYKWTGSIESNQSTVIDLPEHQLARGNHIMDILITTAGDEYVDNNGRSSLSFQINGCGDASEINTFSNIEDELMTDIETINCIEGWERTNRISGTLNTQGNTAYILDGSEISHKTTAYLYSPCYDLSSIIDPVLEFDMAYDLNYSPSQAYFWDIVYIEYSFDEGNTWNLLGNQSDTWYNNDNAEGEGICKNCVGGQWVGINQLPLQTFNYDLDDFSSESSIIFRFVYSTRVSYGNKPGVNIDNLSIQGTSTTTIDEEKLSAQKLNIFPNPTNSTIRVQSSSPDIDAIEVYNVIGTLVAVKNYSISKNTIALDLSSYTKGVYILKVRQGNNYVIHKVLKL